MKDAATVKTFPAIAGLTPAETLEYIKLTDMYKRERNKKQEARLRELTAKVRGN